MVTTLYPVLLDLRGKAGLGGELTAVKEQLRQIPRNGIGYGILRYVSSRSEAEVLRKRHRDPEVAFNYLGQFDQAVAATPHFRALGEGGGMERSPASHRSHLLEFSAKILGGRLLVECGYSEKRHTRATAEKLVRDFLEELQAIVAHCRTRKTSTYTPSDFRDVALSQEDVDQMMEELGEDSSDSHGA